VHALLGKPGVSGFDDDCFVSRDGLAVSIDSGPLDELSENAFEAGRKTIALNASDLCSTGVKPEYFFLSLSLPAKKEFAWVKRFFKGAQLEAGLAGGRIAGGDLNEGATYSIAGVGFTEKPLLRRNCRAGDRMVCSGTVGGAAAARLAKQRKVFRGCPAEFKHALDLPDPGYAFCRRAWRKARAGMDVSDGLAFTLHELARLSRVRVVVEELPVPRRLPAFCERHGWDLVEAATRFGEDYCCVFSGPFKDGFARVEKGKGVFLEKGGELIPLQKEGWEAFIG